MGTRALLGFIIRGQRFGTFTKFDAYPGGLGRWIVEFILSLSEEQIGEMAQRVREYFVLTVLPPCTGKQLQWVDEDSPVPPDFALDYANPHPFATPTPPPSDWASVLWGFRLRASNALPHILDGTLQHCIDDSDFIHDGVFCEWAYYIDFESRRLWIISGGAGDDDDFYERAIGVDFVELHPRWIEEFALMSWLGDRDGDD
ncbi:hypothetical protein EHS25_010294 [Saitozyma podzolica]|uniref:Uncharacterized protein n=1 Tax=Saitozyma podzolica TaxID=1890683 RepID=A0A427YJ53_9TREE|nr:hypothetical protein EHS25_010294 [Saitozyma podzolica]